MVFHPYGSYTGDTMSDEEDCMNWGESLAQVRKKSGLSQERAAEKLGVSRQTISKWENGVSQS